MPHPCFDIIVKSLDTLDLVCGRITQRVSNLFPGSLYSNVIPSPRLAMGRGSSLEKLAPRRIDPLCYCANDVCLLRSAPFKIGGNEVCDHLSEALVAFMLKRLSRPPTQNVILSWLDKDTLVCLCHATGSFCFVFMGLGRSNSDRTMFMVDVEL